MQYCTIRFCDQRFRLFSYRDWFAWIQPEASRSYRTVVSLDCEKSRCIKSDDMIRTGRRLDSNVVVHAVLEVDVGDSRTRL